MKNIKLKYGFILSFALVLLTACEEGDKVFDQIVDQETRGAILRTVEVISNEIPIGAADSNFAVELELQDQENGNLSQSIEVYVAFEDNSIADGGDDLSTEEVLAETLDVSSFEIGSFGLPRFQYSITLPTLISVLPISDTDVDGSDSFNVRFEIVMKDGRRYSAADNSGTLTGSYFNSPFAYSATVVCPPKAPTPGVWTINMTDSYGDGWQTNTGGGGDGIQVLLNDGTILEVGLCSPYGSAAGTFLGGSNCTPNDGSTGTGTITIPDGTETADWTFPGDFYGEIGFEIITPNGNVVGGYQGIEAGPITIDFCKD